MIEIKSFVFSPFSENTYVLYDETGEAIVIDPGCYEPQEYQQLYDFIQDKNLKPVGIYNTHAHIDHVLGVEKLKNKYGIPEPVGGTEMMPAEIELIIVPLLVFDINGNRVGYGKGYYDRFLKSCSENALKVGVSFFEPVEILFRSVSRQIDVRSFWSSLAISFLGTLALSKTDSSFR